MKMKILRNVWSIEMNKNINMKIYFIILSIGDILSIFKIQTIAIRITIEIRQARWQV